jgi:peptidoglycan/xylan/chitin deacetylase (PgdA/CDA1 family)
MKKLIIFLLFTILVLAGCADQASSSSEKTNSHQKKAAASEAKKEPAQSSSNDKSKSKKTDAQAIQVKPEYYVDEKTWTIKPIDPENKKKIILLTFDDAPDKHALEIAKTLSENNIHTIFFINGHFLTTDEKKKTLKKLEDMGHMLGDHTYSHADLTTLKPAEQKQEVMSVYDEIKEITGKPPLFFRAPYGKNTDTTRELAKANHMLLMNWTFGYDFVKQYENKTSLTKIMLNTPLLFSGSIVLMHDRPWTAAALPSIIKGLKEKGFTFVDPHKIKTPAS